MAEITGVVSAKSPYGVKIDDNEEWWNWSLPEYRGEPFDTTVQKGDVVTVTYHEQEKKDVTLKTYLSTIGKVTRGRKAQPDDEVPFEDPWEGTEAQQAAPKWGYEQKDKLIAKVSALKCASEIYSASITVGIIKTLPTPDTIKAYAEAIEATLD